MAPVNIAVIKYWGKRDTALHLPTNSSLSVTLDTADLHTRTSVQVASHLPGGNRMWLNNQEISIEEEPRARKCLEAVRQWRQELESTSPELPPIANWHVHIRSTNNFPTAAGLGMYSF